MKAVVTVLLYEMIPISALISVVVACPLSRRPRFWLRFIAVLIAMLLPDLVVIGAPLAEQTAGLLLWLGFAWGWLLLGSARVVLFQPPGVDPGPGDDGGGGPGPEDGRPTSPAPFGGIPLPDAEPASVRVRDHRLPRHAPGPRRPARERPRLPSRPSPLRLWPS
jgi:hypothetical protein